MAQSPQEFQATDNTMPDLISFDPIPMQTTVTKVVPVAPPAAAQQINEPLQSEEEDLFTIFAVRRKQREEEVARQEAEEKKKRDELVALMKQTEIELAQIRNDRSQAQAEIKKHELMRP